MIVLKNNFNKLLVDNRIVLFISGFILITGILIGFMFHFVLGDINNIKASMATGNYSSIDYIKNNIKASLLLYSGILTFGLSAIVLLLLNGIVIGDSLYVAIKTMSSGSILVKVLPHGVFEIPAILISGSIGLKSLTALIKMMRGKEVLIKSEIKNVIILSILSSVLFIVAGIIEGTLVPVLGSYVDH